MRLNDEEALSNSAFKFNLRRYRKAEAAAKAREESSLKKFEAENARIEARRAKVLHKNVQQRVGEALTVCP